MEQPQPAATDDAGAPDGPPARDLDGSDAAGSVAATMAALEEAERTLTAVDRALEALDGGTYGTCPACGAAVDDAALAADPTALHCAAHRPS